MDSRHYSGLQVVAPGQFDTAQRRRLVAFTAAVGLLGKDRPMADLLTAADFIASGPVVRA